MATANVATQIEIPLEAFSKVVEAIYDCALDPTHWREAVRMVSDRPPLTAPHASP